MFLYLPFLLFSLSTHIKKKKKKFPRLVDLPLVSKSLSKDLELEGERCIEKKAETFPVSCHSKRNLEMCWELIIVGILRLLDFVGRVIFCFIWILEGFKASEMSGCLPCFGSSAKDAASKDSVKKEASAKAKDASVTQSHHVSLGDYFFSLHNFGICWVFVS